MADRKYVIVSNEPSIYHFEWPKGALLFWGGAPKIVKSGASADTLHDLISVSYLLWRRLRSGVFFNETLIS